MVAAFPASIKSFGPAHQDFTENILAAHVNDVQDETTAIETNLGVLPNQGLDIAGVTQTYATVKARMDANILATRTHTHSSTSGVKLDQVNTHQNVDTDVALTSLHHTLGGGANQAAQGTHTHAALPESSITNLVADLAAKASLVGVETLTNKNLTSATNTFPTDTLRGTGIIVMCANAAPAGFLLCDGSAVNRTTYALLYAYLGGAGSTWGQGDGSTTFNVPDMRGRAPVGAGTGAGLTARTLGGSGGAQDSIVASHSHTGSTSGASANHQHDVSHAHTGSSGGGGSHSHATDNTGQSRYAGGGLGAMNFVGAGAGDGTSAAGDHGHTVTVDPNYFVGGYQTADHSHATTVNAAGVAVTDTNMMPWRGVNFAIKTGI